MPYRILSIVLSILLSLSAASAQNGARLVVAWVHEGDLWLWQQGDSTSVKLVTGDVATPYIAPDGKHIAFTRGDLIQSASLWSVEVSTGKIVELALTDVSADTRLLVEQVEWLDANTLYFNTRQSSGPFLLRTDDLWRADILSGEVRQLLPPEQGGAFYFSPDAHHIALVRPGAYDGATGSISLIDSSGQNPRVLLSFPAISTGSEYAYYPLPLWNNASSALLISIPPKDLIYDTNNTLMTTVWQLAVDGTATQLAEVQSSFFGLPQASSDGQYLTYVQRIGDISSNQFDLVVADSDNALPTVYASGSAGTLSGATWFPNTNRFFYIQGDVGDYWFSAPGQPPQRLAGKLYYPHFVDGSIYVYATYPGNPYELRYARIGDSSSELIATFSNPTPVLDAVLLP